ncbi:serine protease [Candidatus Halobeggiatoa sp. HSG11]|nr:serine protease [Candidatus Halobeggiatoa sp. HSG11]
MSEDRKIIHDEIANATVKIFVFGEFQGTGFFITPDGYLLTAFHCIKEPIPNEIIVKTRFDEEFKAEFDYSKSLKSDKFDIAVLKIKNCNIHHYLPLGLVTDEHIFDKLVAPGYPAGHLLNNQNIGIYDGKINRFRDDNRIENEAMKGKGHSGGPVYHYETRRVVGLVSAGYKPETMLNTGLAVRFNDLFKKWTQLKSINNEFSESWDEKVALIHNKKKTPSFETNYEYEESYKYHVFLSYKRCKSWNKWIKRNFLPIFEHWLSEELGKEAKIFWDTEKVETGSWHDRFESELTRSRVLVTLWSPQYLIVPTDQCSSN